MNGKEVLEASRLILGEHHKEQRAHANRDTTHAVYVWATPTPDDADLPVKVVEAALKEHITAKAQFHRAEELRFKKALDALDIIREEAA